MNIREQQEYMNLFCPLDQNAFKNFKLTRTSELTQVFQKQYELDATIKKDSTIQHKNEFLMTYAHEFIEISPKKSKPKLDELIKTYQKELLFVYTTNSYCASGHSKMTNNSLTSLCEEAIIKVSLNNADNRSVIKRCPKRRAKIDIIQFSVKDTNHNKIKHFQEEINQVAKGTYVYESDQHSFIKNLFDISQNKITRLNRMISPAIKFIKDQENIDMVSQLKDSFSNLVNKNFKNKDEIYLKEIIELLTSLTFVPVYVSIQRVTEIFMAFVFESIDKAKIQDLEKLIENDEFGLNYNNTIGLFIHFAIEFNLNNKNSYKERVKWFFCKVFAKGENMKIK